MNILKSFFCKRWSEKVFSKVELSDFVETALVSIIQGVDKAKSKLEKSQGVILPIMGPAFSREFGAKLNHFEGFYYQQVEFDLAITVDNKSTGAIKAEFKVPVISVIEASVDGKYESKNTTVSHIKFHVPVGLSVREYEKN